MKKITIQHLESLALDQRFSKNYNLPVGAIQQIILELNTDWRLDQHRYSRMSKRIKATHEKNISPRQLRYMHKVYKHYESLYEKLKDGGFMFGTFREEIYKKC